MVWGSATTGGGPLPSSRLAPAAIVESDVDAVLGLAVKVIEAASTLADGAVWLVGLAPLGVAERGVVFGSFEQGRDEMCGCHKVCFIW